MKGGAQRNVTGGHTHDGPQSSHYKQASLRRGRKVRAHRYGCNGGEGNGGYIPHGGSRRPLRMPCEHSPGKRHAVSDDGRFKRHERPAGGLCRGHRCATGQARSVQDPQPYRSFGQCDSLRYATQGWSTIHALQRDGAYHYGTVWPPLLMKKDRLSSTEHVGRSMSGRDVLCHRYAQSIFSSRRKVPGSMVRSSTAGAAGGLI